ncbi:hypothetical protein CTAM01_08060 [Colletotrichum tamarilloi]|uniref:Tyrosinase copper-binding domain-containing protein n=1 Tax=Colletotrichum tamarilloi TaxID=1209934 RepID=A0ABQ9R743_9PEZI|nr:uncharacterized protein CTAM01_08060 [Colletotrichum tamarilloi]KAK1497048.1 hypothetical protein CTAM01_08060 [Colletotrichum tamarilloi]
MKGFTKSAGYLALLAALVSETIALPVQDAPLRIEWRSLSSAAKADYISAVKCLDGLPSKIGLKSSRYNDFPYVHAQLNNEIHFVAQFLPWHRYFVHIYETALRDECRYTGPMTYWDWTLDSEDMSKSPVFSNDTTIGFGGNGLNGGLVSPTRPNPLTMCVIDGAFANFTVSYYTTTALSHCLNRGFNDGIGVNAGPYEGGLYSLEKISGIIKTSSNFSTFATTLENGPHGAIHSAVGGDLFPSTSPNGHDSPDVFCAPIWPLKPPNGERSSAGTLISEATLQSCRAQDVKMICSCCRHVLELRKDYALTSNERDGADHLIPHHRDSTSLTASVDAGCYICNRLWAALDIEERCKVRQSNGEPTKRKTPATESPLTSVFWEDGAALAYPRAFLLQLTFDRGKVWYPSRLLDTGPLDQESSSCRLVLPNITPIQGSYATLSHCWGTKESFNLTTSNYAQLQQEIAFDTLPPLYRDAMETSRRLNIRYLWIDSLCIIQHGDDFVDWKQESMHMDKIYSGSFVNISAADAPDANHSLFHDRNPDALCPQIVELPVGSQTNRFLLMDYNFWRTEVSSAVINTRAWVLQERLLSPRVLYFGQRQILWECHQKEDAEIYPEGLLIDLSRFPSRFKGFCHNQMGWRPRDHGDLSKYHYWCNIVNTYTRAKLTFPGDKLIALSAVAKAMRVLLQDSYAAGMWRRYLERQLMWSVAVGEAQARPSVYRAPSWSWAAVDGHITPGIMDVEAVEMLIEVQDLHLDYVTSDTTGLISGGWLQLWGCLKKLELLPDALFSSHSNNYEFLMMIVNGVSVSVRADSVMKEYQPHVYLDDNQQWVSTQNHRPELFCMPARTRPGNDGSIYMLLLQLENGKDGTFRRIGIARGWGKELRESLLASNAEESTLPCVNKSQRRYDGHHGHLQIEDEWKK